MASTGKFRRVSATGHGYKLGIFVKKNLFLSICLHPTKYVLCTEWIRNGRNGEATGVKKKEKWVV